MASVAMIQISEKSPEFVPLCILSSESLSTKDVIECITEAYRQTIPGHVVDCVTLTTSHLGLNSYKIVAEEAMDCVDNEGHDYIEYRTFELLVNVRFVPTMWMY